MCVCGGCDSINQGGQRHRGGKGTKKRRVSESLSQLQECHLTDACRKTSGKVGKASLSYIHPTYIHTWFDIFSGDGQNKMMKGGIRDDQFRGEEDKSGALQGHQAEGWKCETL